MPRARANLVQQMRPRKFYATDEEDQQLKRNASAAGKSFSEFMREAGLRRSMEPQRAHEMEIVLLLKSLLEELRAAAAAVSDAPVDPLTTLALLDRLERIERQLTDRLPPCELANAASGEGTT